MLKKILFCSLLLAPFSLHAADQADKFTASGINWTQKANWSLSSKPVSIAQSLDNKKVFILTEEHKVFVYSADGQKLGEIPVDAGTNAIDIAPRGEMLYLINNQTNEYKAYDVSFNQVIDVTGAPILGNPDAPVTIVEFSDFQCPFCSKVKPALDEVLKEHPDTVRIIYKHLPLVRIHPMAEPAARAAIAAQKQGRFWQMHDALFNLGEEGWGQANVIEEVAQNIGLNMTQFKADWDSEETRMKLAKDMMDAQNADVMATPSLFVNGKPVEDRSSAVINQMVKDALTGTAQPAAKAEPEKAKQ